jgi:hypothetical protein
MYGHAGAVPVIGMQNLNPMIGQDNAGSPMATGYTGTVTFVPLLRRAYSEGGTY